MAFNNTLVARAAASIWGLKLGNATMNAVLNQINSTAGGVNAVLDSAFNASFPASTPNATIVAAVVTNLGLTGAAATDGAAFLTAQLVGVPASARGSKILDVINLFAGATNDPTYGALATAFNAKVAAALAYSSTPGTVDSPLGDLPSATSFNLTLGLDNITGTAGNDTFNAFIFDNSNTLQSGDNINGGAGVDTLFADMGTSQQFSVTPQTTAVENIVIRGQARPADSGDNNIAGTPRVNVDAQRINGEVRYESNNSRADVIVEDVRIASSQITKDITIALVQSDPGNVDFGVYFDQPSLRANSTSSATLTLELLDQQAASEGANPLRDSPYDGFSFQLNGTLVTLTSPAFNEAQLYSSTTSPIGLLQAIQVMLASNVATAGLVTAALGGSFTVTASNGQTVTGTQIVLSATGATLGTGNFFAFAGVPPTSSLYTNQFTGSAVSNALITSTIIVDDVGRGATSGDLMIGSLAIGTTGSGSPAGVERFEITVERNSRLQNIDSTANSLKEVVLKNGLIAGLLSVNGNSNAHSEALPGYGSNPHDDWGFNDVRLIDASAMAGAFTFRALVSTSSYAKYITGTDTQGDPAGDNASIPGTTVQRGDFIYSGGTGNDAMTIRVDGGIAASNSSIQAGSSDFSFRVNGGNGNDSINFRIVDSTNDALPNGQNWYIHQKALRNVTIDAGEGNDTVRKPGAGDAIILLGGGLDTAYVDNTGAQFGLTFLSGAIRNINGLANPATGERAMWTFNTLDQLGNLTPSARNVNDILSDANNNYAAAGVISANGGSLYRATVTVTFMGLTATAQLGSSSVRPNDLFVNQAIKAAINNNAVLNKLVVAEDGPAFSLVVKSLIDGVMATGDLAVVLTALDGTDSGVLSETEFLSVYGALNPGDSTPTRGELQDILNQGLANFNARGDYTTRLARDAAADITGANSVTPSDNTITPGAGNDVIVLGTTATLALLTSSNDTIVYAGNFDNDVIVNFQVGPLAAGGDILNFTALGALVAGAPGQYITGAAPAPGGIGTLEDDTVRVHAETAATDTAAEIAALYADSGSTTGSRTFVYVAVLPNNVGRIYTVVDPVGAANVTATLVGTIDLADTLWGSLTVDNFT